MNPSDLPDETLFEGALKCRTPAERAAYLDQACADQPALRRNLEALLQAHDQSGEFLEPAVAAARPTIKLDLAPEGTSGTMIGRYKLLQKIGEGGMGVVYMAEQTEPVVRKVALKIIKLGMDTKQVVARFEAERQALALMDHPNIAKILDAGVTESSAVHESEGRARHSVRAESPRPESGAQGIDAPYPSNAVMSAGRPYFVMELVHGVPITEYCDKNKLSTQQRLELFIPVCQAIQHAHQKGIIHRDIKPSNVMVTLHDGVPVPKVIDFGVAKATNQRLTEKTLFTHYAQMIGTPAYMSPEQAEMSGLDIDTRTDVYSLGVLLYELLTGSTPFNAKELLSKGYAEMQRIIAQEEPPKPSTRMSTMQHEERTVVATNHSMPASALSKALQGDLDWIVMKCLEKDRTRRYETSNGLAADLRRHLSNELITARPPTTGYLVKKLIKRNRFAFAASAAVAVALVIGIAVSTWQALRATRAERQALATVAELRETAPAFVEQARTLVAQSKFDEGITKLDYAVKLRPDVADYLVAKANLLQCQLKLADAAEVFRTALKVQSDHERASANLRLCDGLIAAQAAGGGNLSTENLAKLLKAMEVEQRSAAELLPVSQRLGKEKDLLLTYWLDRLKDLPIPADKPLKDRLALGESGRLTLDLSSTPISNLSPLADMPLGLLQLSDCRAVTDLTPLRRLPLRTLWLNNTQVSDLSPLTGVTNLARLNLEDTEVSDLSPLRGLKLQFLSLQGCTAVTDISALAGMPLTELRLRSTRATSLAPLRGMPLKWLDVTLMPACDFEHLVGATLETLFLCDVRVNDLSFLERMPLKKLSLWNSKEARNYKVLSHIKTLELILFPDNIFSLPETELLAIDSLQQHPRLQQIASDVGAGFYLETLPIAKEQFWRKWKAYRAMQEGEFDVGQKLFVAEFEEIRTNKGRTHPDTEKALRRVIECQIRAGYHAQVVASVGEVIDIQIQRGGRQDSWQVILDWQVLAAARILAGDVEGYRKACSEMLQRHEATTDARVAEVALKICVLAPSSGVPPGSLQRLAKTALAVRTESWTFTQITCALMDYRMGDWDASLARLHGKDVFNPDALMSAHIDCILAMNYHRLGKPALAAEHVDRARRYLAQQNLGKSPTWLLENWFQLNALLKEVAALIEGSKESLKKDPGKP